MANKTKKLLKEAEMKRMQKRTRIQKTKNSSEATTGQDFFFMKGTDESLPLNKLSPFAVQKGF